MNPGLLGGVALGCTLLFSVAGLLAAILTYTLNDQRWLGATLRLSTLSFVAAVAAFLALEWALLSHDFTLQYVAAHHSVLDPLWVTLVTPWAALEGSILLWGSLQAGYTFAVALRVGRGLDLGRAPLVLGVLLGIQVFFFGVMATVASPFVGIPTPPSDGLGPNPLLQNHWMMAVHPVLMYLGFVGLSVPFAYAIAAMISGRYQGWVAETRWWTLVAWVFLMLAIFAGGWWSYEVLGWGGYWAWDPVENASFIPWLLATAFLHTAQVQERFGVFRSWNIAFIVLSFAVTILGTFLTRSGVVQSVHAFANGPLGSVFLGFFLVVLVLGFGLLVRASARLREGLLLAYVSREGSLLGSALLLATLAAVVLFGTFYPLIVEAASGAKVSIGAPFYNQVSAPLGALMLLLMGIGPLLPWRKLGGGLRPRLVSLAAALVGGTVLGLLVGWTVGVSLAVGLGLYNLVAIAWLALPSIKQKQQSLGVSWVAAALGWASQSRRRLGSMVVHLGVALCAVAIAFSQAYRLDAEKTLRIGQRWEVAGIELQLKSLNVEDQGNRTSVGALVGVKELGTLTPYLRYYPSMGTPIASPAVRYGLITDYYLVLQQFDQKEGSWATLRLVRTPLVLWLWIAAGIMALGVTLALWPAGHRQSQPRVKEATA